jgi:hypothetical protein
MEVNSGFKWPHQLGALCWWQSGPLLARALCRAEEKERNAQRRSHLAHRRVTPVLSFLPSRRSFALFWIRASSRARARSQSSVISVQALPKQGSFTTNTSFPGLPWRYVLFPAPQGARGGLGMALGHHQGARPPPSGPFRGNGPGPGGGGGGKTRVPPHTTPHKPKKTHSGVKLRLV